MLPTLEKYFVSIDSIQQLIIDQVPESLSIEYKRDPYNIDKDKSELCRDVSAIANARGGYLMIGMETNNDNPINIAYFIGPQRHEMCYRDILKSKIVPSLSEKAFSVITMNNPGNKEEGIIVVKIPAASPSIPHAVCDNNKYDFWIRVDKTKQRMTYEQLRNSFRPSEYEEQQRIDANAISEIRNIAFEIKSNRNNWELVRSSIEPLFRYTRGYGYSVVREVLEATEEAICFSRYGITLPVAADVVSLLENILPLGHLLYKTKHPIPEEEISILREATEIAFNLSYDAIKYLNDLVIAYKGIELLWRILRYGHLNEQTELINNALKTYNELYETASHLNNENAKLILLYSKNDALNLDQGSLTPMPDGLEWIIMGGESPTDKDIIGLVERIKNTKSNSNK